MRKLKFKNINKSTNILAAILIVLLITGSLIKPKEMSKVENLEIFTKQEVSFQENFDNEEKLENNYNANQNKDNIDAKFIGGEKPEIQNSPLSKEVLSNLNEIPVFKGENTTVINNNKTFFPDKFPDKEFESYSNLDKLGRVGVAEAFIGKSLMPSEKRSSIGMVKPSGWHTVRYDNVIKDKYLYNRCHLIAYMLTGENANPKNLMTGTRQFNVDGMLPYEDMVNKYIKSTGDRVWYRITPYFEGNDLVAKGILMEGKSFKKNGLEFCVFVHNVQNGIEINYKTGESKLK